ncbi:hypothetical protein ACGFMO_20755 [Streptomyces niveus]|uniref:hypothetical protein n=1 Tax=Streptomyces niveus TaxID=193462 RepID=UPI00371A716D
MALVAGDDGHHDDLAGHRVERRAAEERGELLAERTADPTDARRKLVRLTPHGLDALARSARIFDELRARWSATLGPDRLRALETDLRTVTPPDTFTLDAEGWLGGP